jgi:FKBP-type peptidyl-prolyl cis-trans isomerase
MSKEDLGYALGVNVASSLKAQNFTDFDKASFVEGLNDLIGDKELKMSEEKVNEILQKAFQEASEKKFSVNKDEGASFLAENAKRSEVTTLESGLQYEVVTSGEGKTPAATDTVTTHYHGTLINGTVFDSSIERDQPASFPVNQVIKGWTEALQLMKEGDKWRLYIPENLAYGANPHPNGPIEPYMTLIFDIELISVD